MRSVVLCCLAVLVLMILATATWAEVTPGGAVEALQQRCGNDLKVRLDPDHKTIRSLHLESPMPMGRRSTLPTIVTEHGAAFGLWNPQAELEKVKSFQGSLGIRHDTYQQMIDGFPVLGGALKVHSDYQGRLTGVTARLAPFVALSVGGPEISRDSAEAVAHALVGDQAFVKGKRLVVVRTGMLRGATGGPDRLAWEIAVEHEHIVIEHIYVDAVRGVMIERVPEIADINRVVHHLSFQNPIWSEGDPRPVTGYGADTDAEAETLIETAGHVHELFSNISGGSFLSWNGNDATMHSVVDMQHGSCPNAWWTGSHTRFCDGMATDDIAAHEWTHAYTDGTHGLIYLWQSGALNEAYSDIFGEVVDQLNGTGFDTPGGPRTPGLCSAYAGGEPSLVVTAPMSATGSYTVYGALFNPDAPWSAEAPVEIVPDGNGGVDDACSPISDFTPGNIALIKFGGCLFYDPAVAAQEAGASGVIVLNPFNDAWLPMVGSDQLQIPVVMIGKTNGEILVDVASQGELVARLGSAEASTRWLIGEDSGLGAIRDMWVPPCDGDPGSVGDSLYRCDLSADNGGVHSNSGVPNRAFAQLVDGGEVNGVHIPSIGVTKASHIYWRAMSVYQLPISDFSDHADALEASCQDLLGVNLTDLQTGSLSGAIINQQDCSAVTAAIQAVGLRNAPPCNFGTVLDPEHPATRRSATIFDETFDEAASSSWTLEDEGVFAGQYIPRSWTWRANPPEGGNGGAMFAASDPFVENCDLPFQAGIVSLTTPGILIPQGSPSPMMVVDHYVATPLYPWGLGDGGNIKMSINGGDFVLVDDELIAFNSYPGVLPLEGDHFGQSQNPLAGEPAFMGINDGFFEGSWGQTQVDLQGILEPGDEIRFRFDFGTDGCGGLDGWYLDRVRVVSVSPAREGSNRAP